MLFSGVLLLGAMASTVGCGSGSSPNESQPPQTAAAPLFSVAAGTYSAAQAVTLSDTTSGASIYYTTNGSAPTASSTVYSGPITVSGSEIVEAIAIVTGYTSSAVTSAAYVIALPAAAPAFSVAAGTYVSAQSVTLTDATAGAQIYYTTNGTTPTASSTLYTGPVTVSTSQTLQAVATATGYTTSPTASAAYVITLPAATPVFSIAAGTYTSTQTVALADTTAGATIFYTTNGSTPTTSSTPYTGPVTVSTSETLQAIATATGYTTSPAASAVYVITLPAATPTFSIAAGTYTSAQTIAITDATPGAQIFYTTNGSTPTTSSTPYTAPITVSASETLEAIATATGSTASPTASAAYVIGNSASIAGVVTSSSPIAGAHVYLFAAGSSGYGQGSVSLLNATLTGHSDSVGAYALSAADGTFSLTGAYTCAATDQLYLYTQGGDAGAGQNAASGMLAVLGPCPTSSSPAISAHVNEVTTVAAAYALAGFATDATHISSSGTPLAQTGVANAFANAGNLVNLATGAALTTTPAGNGAVPQATINTLANILASCVITPNACNTLLSTATSSGTVSGTMPVDTATAAINIARHPGSNVASLSSAASSQIFTPALPGIPKDFALVLRFTGGGLDVPQGLAIDAEGNVWTDDSRYLTELSSVGAVLSPSTGYPLNPLGGTVYSSYGKTVAIDLQGNVWVSGGSAVYELSSAGVTLSPSGGYAQNATGEFFNAAIDASGNVWVTDSATAVELSSTGILLSPAAGYSLGLIGTNLSFGIAATSSGNLAIATQSDLVTISESGSVLSSVACCGSPSPTVAIDAQGTVWVAGPGNGVDKISAGSSSSTTYRLVNIPFSVDLSDVAVDGAGNIWLANTGLSTGALIELSPSGGELSPTAPASASWPDGYAPYYFANPTSVAVDGAGDVWLNSNQYNTITHVQTSTLAEVIGIATPVVTPLAAGVKNNTLGTRP